MRSIFIVLNEKNQSAVFPVLLRSLFKEALTVTYIILGNAPGYSIPGVAATDILHIPYPMGRENIDSYNEERRKKYAQRALDVIIWKAMQETQQPLFVFTHHSQYVIAQTCRERITCNIAVCLENLHWQTTTTATPCEHTDEAALLQLADEIYTIDDPDWHYLQQLYPAMQDKHGDNTIQPDYLPATTTAPGIHSYGFRHEERLLFIDAAGGNMHHYGVYLDTLLSAISGLDNIRLVFNHTLNSIPLQQQLRQLIGKTVFCPDAETAADLAEIASVIIVLEPYSRRLALWRNYTSSRYIIHIKADNVVIPASDTVRLVSLSITQTAAISHAIAAALHPAHLHLVTS